ncbi:hypothetical protein F4827_006894 [Paraburkholderia bannensis]|uniref:Uncharacterized protein n=1 Tax=Paraburkholderia bannensis TaxID=765414 RepID=A0A7W9U4T6_9BURK|nr:hypothetical protein [Paraburkholderia sp. WP4_3_2]MBB6107014.1 hypothetical protein [Paraburkholderia bannensis]
MATSATIKTATVIAVFLRVNFMGSNALELILVFSCHFLRARVLPCCGRMAVISAIFPAGHLVTAIG